MNVVAGWPEWTPEDAKDQLDWLARSTTALSDDPERLGLLKSAFKAGDVRAFAQTLHELWRDLDLAPPADKCDPYVTRLVELFPTLTMVWKCWWVGWPAGKRGNQVTTQDPVDLTTAFDPKDAQEPFARILEMLIRNGIVQCGWVPELERNVLQARVFVQGSCPPGTF